MVGETIGNYRIVARIGAGGMGEVYRATHLRIEREVAIKVLLPELAQSKPAVARFLREARATSLIRHPGIVEVFDCAVHGDGRIYIVMELLTGESLGEALARRGSFAGDFAGAGALMVQIADAVGAAHDKGIVHRDLKPDNIFLQRPPLEDRGGPLAGREDREAGQGAVPRVKVLDFGIAKLMSPKFPGVNQTRTGEFFGTPLYMAPEQCRGGGSIDHRADIYALGCIAYHMLSGRPPFVHDGTGDLVIAHALEQPADVASLVRALPRALGDLVMQMLAKLPDDRPASMVEVARRIEAIPPVAHVAPVHRGAAAAATSIGEEAERSAGGGSGGTGTRLFARAEIPVDHAAPAGRARARVRGRIVVALAAVCGVAAAIAVFGIGRPQHGQPPSVTAGAEPPVVPVWEAPIPAAPAPPPAPAATVAAGAADVTTVDVTTVPPGAEVWMAGEGAPRGVTPVRVSFGRQSVPRHLLLRTRGYVERRVVVDGDRDSVIAVDLQRTEPGPRLRGLARSSTATERPAAGEGRRRTGPPAGSSVGRSPESAREPADPARPSRYRRMAD